MAIKQYRNEYYNQQGELVNVEEGEYEVPDSTPMTEFVNTLSEEQKSALLSALQNS